MTGRNARALDWAAIAAYLALALAWFWPVLGSGRLLAPGDGFLEYVPNYLVHRTLWEPLLGTGYPAAADPLTFTWYPPALLLSWIPGSYNAFVLCAYVLAAWFTYLLVLALTGSRFAGWISGLLYGFSGFLMAHTGHPSVIHAALWIPAVLLAMERVRDDGGRRWFVFGCFAVGSLVLSGHPQIMLYGLTLAVSYAAVRGFTAISPKAFWCRTLMMLACGIGLGAVLLVPLFEFSRLTVREHVTFETFNSFHLPIRNLVLLFFPYLYGGEEGSIYGERLTADTEQDVFLGVLTLLLASLALFRRKQYPAVYFFAAAAVVALLCSLGGASPLGHVLFHIPLFNQFRGQGRFLVVFQLSMAVLAGIGIRNIIDEPTLRRRAAQLGCALLLIQIGAALGISQFLNDRLTRWAASLGAADTSFDITTPALMVPMIASLAGILAVTVFARHTKRPFSMALLSIAIIADLGTFGLFASWRYYRPTVKELEPPLTAGLVRSPETRFVTVRGFLGKAPELPPNLSKLWRVASLATYGSLAIERYHSLLGIDSGGTLAGGWADDDNRALDLCGANYVIAPDDHPGEMNRFQRIPVPAEDLSEDFGGKPGATARESAAILLDNFKSFTAIALVSYLRDAFAVPRDTPVLQLRLKATTGDDVAIPVLAGRDSADLFAECPETAPRIKHGLATVFSTSNIERSAAPCKAHTYFAKWPLDPDRRFERLDIKWLLAAPAGMSVVKLVLWGNRTGDLEVVSAPDFHSGHFQRMATRQMTRIYKNVQAMPRAWLVSEVVQLSGEDVKQAIRTSRLPDGRRYDPAKMALAEDFHIAGAADPNASAVVTDTGTSSVEIRTHCKLPAFLTLADLYYPGWTATINGASARIVQTNYVQRGVVLPAGDNIIRFIYRPKSLYLGIAITLSSLALCVGLSGSLFKTALPHRA